MSDRGNKSFSGELDRWLSWLVAAGFVGMVFTIQVAREFINFGATTTVGGVLAIASFKYL